MGKPTGAKERLEMREGAYHWHNYYSSMFPVGAACGGLWQDDEERDVVALTTVWHDSSSSSMSN